MHRRRGGEARKRGDGPPGVTPATDQYPSLAAGFRRRALFFEQSTIRQIRAASTAPVISISLLRPLKKDPGPYVSGTVGANERNNHAYGISCRTRPTPSDRQRPSGRNRYRMGRLLRTDPAVNYFTIGSPQGRRARPEKWPDLEPADCRSGILQNGEANNLIRPYQPTGSTPQ